MTCERGLRCPMLIDCLLPFQFAFAKTFKKISYLSCVERAHENRVVAKFMLALLCEAITIQTSSQDL